MLLLRLCLEQRLEQILGSSTAVRFHDACQSKDISEKASRVQTCLGIMLAVHCFGPGAWRMCRIYKLSLSTWHMTAMWVAVKRVEVHHKHRQE